MRTSVLCLSALLLAACTKDAPEAVVIDENAAIDTITQQALYDHIAYLADDAREGRMAGERGYDEAAQYVADRVAEMGLTPGGDDGWYQQVPLISYRIDEESTTLIAHRDGEDTELQYKEHFVMGGDKVREETSVRAEVVYVGFGVHAPEVGYSDYDGIDVEGKIVALFGNAPAMLPSEERAYYSSGRTKAEEAVRRVIDSLEDGEEVYDYGNKTGAWGTVALLDGVDYELEAKLDVGGLRPTIRVRDAGEITLGPRN